MATTSGRPPDPWWKPVWKLVVEVWVGSGLFAVLFAPAVALDLTVKALKTSWQVSDFLLTLLTWTKYAIAGVDALLYIVFMLNMAWHFLNELRWRHPDHA